MKKYVFFSLLLVLFSCNKTVNEDLPKEKSGEIISTNFENLYFSLKNDENFLMFLENLKHRGNIFVENMRAFEDKNYLDQLDDKMSKGIKLTNEEYLQVLSLYGFSSEEDHIAKSNSLSNSVESLINAHPGLENLTEAQFQSIVMNLYKDSIFPRSAPPCIVVCGACYDDATWDCLAHVGWNTISGVGTGIGFGSYGGFYGGALGGIIGGFTGYGYGLYLCYRGLRDCDQYVPPGCSKPCGEM